MNLKSKPIKDVYCRFCRYLEEGFEIEPTFCNNIVDAVYKCMDGCNWSIERIGNPH